MATINIIVHPEWDLTEKVAVGELVLADVMQELERFYGGPVTRRVLWDLSQVTFTSLGIEEITQITAAIAPLLKRRAGGKSAVVASSDLGFGFSRMYQSYREIQGVELPYMSFRSRQEAIDWLLADVE